MKKFLSVAAALLLLLFLLSGAILGSLDFGHVVMEIDDPSDAMELLLASGGALLVAVLAIVSALVAAGVALAGAGLVLVCGLALGALVLVLCLTPLLLPLLLPLVALWAIVALTRKPGGTSQVA